MTVISFLAGICVGILVAAVAIVTAVSLENEEQIQRGDRNGNDNNKS